MPPRCKKSRKCGCQLKVKAYKPTSIPMRDVEKIVLYKDELESLKLCGYGWPYPGGGRIKNGISRGTAQRILSGARKKVDTALSKRMALVMEEIICKQEKFS